MSSSGLSERQSQVKRAFDVVVAVALLVTTWPAILIGWIAATVETRVSGLFRQTRVGLGGDTFEVLKLRTMTVSPTDSTTVTRRSDDRITVSGRVMRKFKVDELPQLVNVLRGEMSIVGPRPDVPGFADRLEGDDRIVLSVRPGITGPATLAYRHEEVLLDGAENPEQYNSEVIWPDKVRRNREYVQQWSLRRDVDLILATVLASLRPRILGKDELVV